MPTAASIARMVVPSLALLAAGGAVFFFGLPQVRRELPVEAGAAATARSTVGAAPLRRTSDAGDEFTPVFDVARIDPTGDAVIAGRAAPSASVELLPNGYVHDRAVADRSGQLASAVWTGDTRDTRPVAAVGGQFILRCTISLLDNLVGDRQQRFRDSKAEGFGGLKV
jgi:hypothetical protein